MKQFLKNIFRLIGFELKKINPQNSININRPVGDFKILLEDLKQRGLKCKTVFDIGANKAEWSHMLKSIYPEAKCILIEPLVECEPELKLFVNKYKDSSYYLVAAGSENTEQLITIWDDLYGSSLLPPEDVLKTQNGKQRSIVVRKLEDFIKEHHLEIPQIMKIDVQGFELETLKGLDSILGMIEIIVLEVSLFSFDDVPGMPEFIDIVDFMNSNNYVVYDFPGFLRRPLDGALGQCDVCFVKRDSFLRSSKRWK